MENYFDMPCVVKTRLTGCKLNISELPRVISVRRSNNINSLSTDGKFYCGRNLPVPLATTRFVAIETGNCNPRFMRASINVLPDEVKSFKQTGVPLSLSISPLAELQAPHEAIPIVLQGNPQRCTNCNNVICIKRDLKGNPYSKCFVCGPQAAAFLMPEDFQLRTVEYQTQKSENDQVPFYIFVFETTQTTMKNGLQSFMKKYMESILMNLVHAIGLEKDVHFSFWTYSDDLHFWTPGEVVGDTVIYPDGNGWIPVPNVFYHWRIAIKYINIIMNKIVEKSVADVDMVKKKQMFPFIIEALSEAFKSCGKFGKIFLFHSSSSLIAAQDQDSAAVTAEYKALSNKLVNSKCAIDMFLCATGYIDVLNKGYLCHQTGGLLKLYVNFKDEDRLFEDLKKRINQTVAFNCILQVQTTSNLKIKSFYGNIYEKSLSEVKLCSADSRTTIVVELDYVKNLQNPTVIQVLFYFTTSQGSRRLRIFQYEFNISSQVEDFFNNIDVEVLMNLWSKRAIYELLFEGAEPDEIRSTVKKLLAQIIFSYANTRINMGSNEELVHLPLNLSLILPYCKGLIQNTAVFGAIGVKQDQQFYEMYNFNSMNVAESIRYIYPALIKCTSVISNDFILPEETNSADDSLVSSDAFILDDCFHQFLFMGLHIPESFIFEVFNSKLDENMICLPEYKTTGSINMRSIVEELNKTPPFSKKLFLVKQGGSREIVFRQYVIECDNSFNRKSYLDFIEEVKDLVEKIRV